MTTRRWTRSIPTLTAQTALDLVIVIAALLCCFEAWWSRCCCHLLALLHVMVMPCCCCCRFCCCCICCCTASFAIPLLLAHLPCISQLQDALYERVINTFTPNQELFAALLFTRSVMTSYSHEVNSGPGVEVDFHAKGDQCNGRMKLPRATSR